MNPKIRTHVRRNALQVKEIQSALNGAGQSTERTAGAATPSAGAANALAPPPPKLIMRSSMFFSQSLAKRMGQFAASPAWQSSQPAEQKNQIPQQNPPKRHVKWLKIYKNKNYSDGDAIIVKNQGSVGASDLSDRHFLSSFFRGFRNKQ
ncbi:polynucleotidyl transferase [Striga asiatica]|uniref:Polynucleotidyl transferase n=1 Tax=Striga asiatica TaxID=4170 RepID=A0A5A7QP39_STRAF|nr:polynucleotidyl transferase [Striga asiatica]